ncbi:MAG: flagellar protein FlgN [Gallionella sp.]|nr:flagellar protein FlgN [Gallionella sp.]
MTSLATSGLLTALNSELGAVRAFVALLQQEQRLLTENQTEPLLALAEQKSLQPINLNQLAESRISMLEQLLPDLSNEAIDSWLAANSAKGYANWQEIRELAKQARQLNRVNGELIQMKMRHNQQTLVTLTQAVNKADLYGPDGQRSFTPGSGRSLGNV